MSERRCCKVIVTTMSPCTNISFHLTVNGHQEKARFAPTTALGELEVVRVLSGNAVVGFSKTHGEFLRRLWIELFKSRFNNALIRQLAAMCPVDGGELLCCWVSGCWLITSIGSTCRSRRM